MMKLSKLFAPVLFMILLATAVAASVSVTYNFKDIQTGNPVYYVDVLVYPCLDNGCNSLDLSNPLPGSGNSGSSPQLAIIYPTNLITQYGYAAYYFADSYVPQEYKATWHGTGSTSFNINFNRKENCISIIEDLGVGIDAGNSVDVTAEIQSAFNEINNGVGYVLPQYINDFYSSVIEVRFSVYDSNNMLVYEDTQYANLFMGTTGYDMTASNIVLQPGDYRAEVETRVTDSKCANTIPVLASVDFTIQDIPAQCEDGIDNDGDGLIDFPADPGCIDASDDNETDEVTPPLYECNDGIDNDGDGLIDFPNDPGCVDENDDNETDPVVVCEDHLDISSARMGFVDVYEGGTFEVNNLYIDNGVIPFDYIFNNTGSEIRFVNYTTRMESDVLVLEENSSTPVIVANGIEIEVEDFDVPQDLPNGTYNVTVFVEGFDEQDCYQEDLLTFYALVNRTQETYECSDGIDNDGDGLIDFPNDPGCDNPVDDNETDDVMPGLNVTLTADPMQGTEPLDVDFLCNVSGGTPDYNYTFIEVIGNETFVDSDSEEDDYHDYDRTYDAGIVNATCIVEDSQGRTGSDSVIINITAQPVLPECSDGIDNDGDGLIDFPNDPGCIDADDNNETDEVNQTNQAPVVQLIFPFDNMILGIDDIGFIYGVTDDSSVFVDCTLYNNVSGTFEPVATQTIFAGLFGLFNIDNIPNGTYEWNVECSDGTLSAFAPSNFTFTTNTSATVTQCSDGIDNDGDGLVDMNDPGCDSPADDDETDPAALPQCSDGIDNDGDGLIDMDDPDCQSPEDDDESSEPGPGEEPEEEEEEILHPEQLLYIGHIDIHSTTNLGFEQETARPGDEVEVSVYLENLASYDLEELKLTIYIDELGVWRTIGPFDLEEGDHTVKHVYIDIPEDTQPGEYDVRIVVENQEVKRVKYRVVAIIWL